MSGQTSRNTHPNSQARETRDGEIAVLWLLHQYDIGGDLAEHRIAWLTRLPPAEVAEICLALSHDGFADPVREKSGERDRCWIITQLGRDRIAEAVRQITKRRR